MSMTLRYTPMSPFARKVRVFAHELGLEARIELAPADIWGAHNDAERDNPLGTVPVLLTGDGRFIGSTLCCEYLDSLHDGPRLIPRQAPACWPVWQRHALADGVMTAAVAHVTEKLRRPRAYVYTDYLNRQIGKIERALQELEADRAATAVQADLATITLGCALEYLDVRLPELQWRTRCPSLAEWLAKFGLRSSLQRTQYRG